jgi:TetR/AcrR family transcriptional repressor of nem operon
MSRRATDLATKDKLVAAAYRLMQTKGFVATGVEDVCAAAGVTKGAFFHYFPSKEALGLAVVEERVREYTCAFETAPFMKETDPLKRLHGYLDTVCALNHDATRPTGCLVGMFAQELAETHPEVRALCAQSFESLRRFLEGLIEEARAAYAPRAAIDVRSVADHFIAILQGALILARVRQDRRVIETQVEHFRAYLDALFGVGRTAKRKKVRPAARLSRVGRRSATR